MSAALSLLLASLLAPASLAGAWKTYVVLHVDGTDDAPVLAAALASGNYSENATILFEKGITYNVFTPITFPKLTNVEVAVEGNLTYPEEIKTVQASSSKSDFKKFWFYFSGGTNVTLRGTTDPNWGWVDGHGQVWWDAIEQNYRPHGWSFSNIKGGEIKDMKLWMPIEHNFATSGLDSLHVHHNTIIAFSSNDAFPFNTDGFSAGGTNSLFENNYIVNADDCLTVGSGGKNVTFRNSYCEGGHGLSIGSLGKNGAVADVQNIHIENVVVKNSLYAARFKSWKGGNGLARNITWKNISFDDVRFPIFVSQNYWDQESGTSSTSDNSTYIQDITFQNFAGSIHDGSYFEGSCITDPCWQGDRHEGTATNIVTKNFRPRTRTGAAPAVMCDPATITSDVGFKCWDGVFIPTRKGY